MDALEKQLDRGFFLSFINKIVVDEKKIFTIINELRSLASGGFPDADNAAPRNDGPENDMPPMEFQGADSFQAAVRALDVEMRRLETLCRQSEEMRAGVDGATDKALVGLQECLGRAIQQMEQGRGLVLDQLKITGGEA